MIAREFWPTPGTAHGPVRHGEDTHPADSGIRSVTSLLAHHLPDYPGLTSPAIRSVQARERRRTAPMFAEHDTVRLPRIPATASAPLGVVWDAAR